MSDSLEERRVGGRERDKQYVYISLHTMNITGITIKRWRKVSCCFYSNVNYALIKQTLTSYNSIDDDQRRIWG